MAPWVYPLAVDIAAVFGISAAIVKLAVDIISFFF